jgi:hypothetical protein
MTPLIGGKDSEKRAGLAGKVFPNISVVTDAVKKDDGSFSRTFPLEVVESEGIEENISADRLGLHLPVALSFFDAERLSTSFRDCP